MTYYKCSKCDAIWKNLSKVVPGGFGVDLYRPEKSLVYLGLNKRATCTYLDFYHSVGDHDFNQNEGSEVELGVSEIFAHERYHRSTLDYDIALIKLNRPVPFDNQYISSVCLPTKDEVISVGTTCYITGN